MYVLMSCFLPWIESVLGMVDPGRKHCFNWQDTCGVKLHISGVYCQRRNSME